MALAPNKALPDKKDDQRFTPGAAASYASHQTSEKVTIGVKAYFDDEDTRPVFGKKNPYNYGVLPGAGGDPERRPKTIRVQSAASGVGRAPTAIGWTPRPPRMSGS